MSDQTVHLKVDGRDRELAPDGDRLLLDALREDLSLTAPKWGCGTGDCGACTVLLDGSAVDSCLVYAAECEGAVVETASAVAESEVGAVLAEEFALSGAVQCGVCTPGFLVAVSARIQSVGATPSYETLVDLLSGNVCRCTGYRPIVEAVQRAALRLNGEPGGPR